MRTFSASHAGKHFGEVREHALAEPVGIARRGKVNVVMLSAEEYARLKALDSRRALAASELPADRIRQLEETRMDPRHNGLDSLMDET